ncbi:MAG: tail fiber domain-containing protein [Flavobacteriales bacterium]
MKHFNLKLASVFAISLFSYSTFAQQPWRVGGNSNLQLGGMLQPTLGTNQNRPLLFETNSINRVYINQNKTPTINAFNVNTSGFVGIGEPNYSVLVGGGPFWSTQGPFSLLHLNGQGGGQELGYRPWMQTGITFTEGFDLSYVGNRVVDANNDHNEFTIAWSNDPTNPQFGPDDMVFRFLSGRAPGTGGSTVSGNFSVANDLDGLHVARFTSTGEMGLGSTFGLLNPLTGARPQSLLHMSLDDFNEVWMQITNRLGTDQTANDGLRFGINAGGNSSAYLRWQERSPFIVQTDWDATAGGINNGERMRISSIGSNGVPKPANFIDDNVTRVAISHRGNSPITAPRSLLHLGYNTGNGLPLVVDGWRDWMDIGTFTNNGTDNIYVGLKEEGPDRFDAVINWGDNQVAGNTPNGPDNLRFIFTSTTTALPPGGGDPVSQSNNGLETARIVPTKASTLPNSNFGMMGIGDWTTAFNIANPIDAKLDIDGDLRIRTVTQDNTLTQILAIDPTDHNRVHWIDGSNLGGNVAANNGVSVDINNPNTVQLGVPCQDALGNDNIPEILANALTEDRVVAIGDYNLWFATYTGQKSGVGIGGQPASTNFCTTGNTLEVSANGSSKYGVTASSGLRFTQLKSTDTPLPNGTNGLDNTKVLSVDQDGDVVLVDAVGGGIGNYCSQLQNPLTDNYEIPLNNFNYYFTSGGLANSNNVYIGVPCSTNAPSRLNVFNDTEGHGILSYMDANGTPMVGLMNGLRAKPSIRGVSIVNNATTSGTTVGVVGEAISNASWGSIGVFGYSSGTGVENIGGRFEAVGASQINNYGVRTSANGSAGKNYGLWASAPTINPLDRAAYFNGTIEILSGPIITSDQKFKTNVEVIKSATDILRKLRPHTYKMDISHYPQFNFQDRLQYGFIAQEVGEVLPDLVYDSYMPSELDSLGNEIHPAVDYKSLNYNALIPIAIQAINEINEKQDKSTLSDQSVKTNVSTLNGSLAKVKQMRGVSYEWTPTVQNDMNLDSLEHIGFIAQEVAAIEPLLTFVDDSSLVHVNYDRVAPLLVESVKELDDKILAKDSIINHLQNEINTIKECLRTANICYGEGNRAINSEPINNTNNKSVELVNSNSIILDQNMPNPFAENTVINYNIPTEVMEAKLLFYDLNGRIIKELMIEERGESKLTVYGNNLKTGVYTYSLIADGELIATKKMVKK